MDPILQLANQADSSASYMSKSMSASRYCLPPASLVFTANDFLFTTAQSETILDYS
jgi:hypothetical protein